MSNPHANQHRRQRAATNTCTNNHGHLSAISSDREGKSGGGSSDSRDTMQAEEVGGDRLSGVRARHRTSARRQDQVT